MSLETSVTGDPVHQPKRRDLFKFDDEVASIFDNMAPRSIPLYNEVHRMHVSMLRDRLIPGAAVADIGSSTGHLFRNIEQQLGKKLQDTGIAAYAIDSSRPMMDLLRVQYPTVVMQIADLCDLALAPKSPVMDLTFCLYTLQFMPPDKQATVLAWLVGNMKIGGYIVLGQKEGIADTFAYMFADEYYQFRRDNGYSQDEIDAKTAALKGSMWTIPQPSLMRGLAHLGVEAIETSRWLGFSTVMGIRKY